MLAATKIEPRQEELLNLVVENFINTAEPIGSKFLAYKEKVGWSEATIRNDLRALEEAGYLTHPHTSAGRIPTENGYRFYIKNLDRNDIRLSAKESAELERVYKQAHERDLACKALAKESARITREAIIVAFNLDRVFYTGLSSLFDKPEFTSSAMVINTSRMFDQCEECLNKFYDTVGDRPEIFIGSEHPFGSYLSVVASRTGKKADGLFLVFGPMRMNYKKNFAVVSMARDLIK